ncbi:hypothetical protein ANRL1_01643 [Anaerolineae bacterium]|nr:hypothetical protein ANRL1_01643 [Anaerolineae bacterium]
MQALKLLIELIDPLLATQPQSGEQNSAVTYPFIPGSAIRGALVQGYLNGPNVALADAQIQALFFDGTVRYLNGYLAHPGDDTRALPKPLGWFVRKSEADQPTTPIFDFAIERPASWDEPAKSPRGDFFWRGADATQLGTPAIQVAVHNASTERNQKKEGVSQVYRYDSLAPRQRFAAAIISEDATLLDKLKPLVQNQEFRLGGSHTAGYGRVKIIRVETDLDWSEYMADSSQENKRVTLTCLSDVIVRGQNGQTGDALIEAFGVLPLESFSKLRVVGGFNRTWGLPLTQAWAIQVGSVFVFESHHRAALAAMVKDGIGERRAEGFGRVALDLNTQTNLTQSEWTRAKIEPNLIHGLAPTSHTLAQKMANRRLQSMLDVTLAKEIADLTHADESFWSLPSPAQLSRAQIAARQAWLSGDLDVIRDYFKDLSALSKREWTSTRIKDEFLLGWIDATIAEYALPDEIPTVAGVTAEAKELRVKATARLIEGVLKQAVKRAKQQREGGQHG